MGTNFYHHDLGGNERHVGKSSAGWTFCLHVYPDEMINTLADWLVLLTTPDTHIKNEYGGTISVKEMLARIMDRSRYHYPLPTAAQLVSNHAVEGPNGLMRHPISNYCIGHGEGTWDYHIGDFR